MWDVVGALLWFRKGRARASGEWWVERFGSGLYSPGSRLHPALTARLRVRSRRSSLPISSEAAGKTGVGGVKGGAGEPGTLDAL